MGDVFIFLVWNLEATNKKPERLEPRRLGEILQQFDAEVKRNDGTDYEPSSLVNMQAALDYRRREAGYMYSLLTSRCFLNSRNVLAGKTRLLKEQGKGIRTNKSCSVSNDEMEQLWQSSQFEYYSPMALINTFWWLFTLHCGLRGRQEHHNMKIGISVLSSTIYSPT